MKSVLIRILFIFTLAGLFPTATGAKDFTIVIDAGHGGKDAGSVDNGVKEKDVNLSVALKLSDMIKKKMKGVKVVLTRDDDTYLTLQQRADKANSSKGDLLISIHSNSVDLKNPNRTKVNGTSTHVLGLHKDANNMAVARRENSVIKLESDYQEKYSGFDPSSDESYIIFEMAQKKNLSRSISFANSVQKQMKSIAGRKDNGVHQNGFWVLWATSMPAVLIELDFICNPTSAEFISSNEGQNKMATAIFNAVKDYYNESKKPPVAEEVSPAVEEDDNSGSTLITKVKDSEKTSAPLIAGGNTTKRRRRSDASRKKSEQRNLETTDLIIRMESDAEPVNNQLIASSVSSPSVPSSNKSTSKSGSTRKKADPKTSRKKDQSKHAHLNRDNSNYQVLLLTSDEKINPEDPRFSRFAPVTCISEAGHYSYFSGKFDNLTDARSLLNKAKEKFSDAVIVTSLKSSSKNN